MAGFWTISKTAIRTGSWLTAERIRNYCLILLVIAVGASTVWVALSEHLIDRNGKPIGTDFSSYYAAGTMAREGRAVDVYDMAAHYARQQQILGTAVPYYAWYYPPVFLAVAHVLAFLPYSAALAVWQGATLLLYLCVIGLIVRNISSGRHNKLWLLAALAYPAVFINLGHGQNGCLTAALLGGALLALQNRPLLAGVLFGLLAYKPQFALVIPLALLAAGQWRAILAAGLTVVLLAGATAMMFGTETWFAFATSTEISRKLLLEQGEVGFEKLQSVFAAVRMWGGGVILAYVVQGTVSVAVICTTAWMWRSRIDHAQKAVLLVIATLLASPHTLDYDLTVAGIAIAYYVTTGITRGFAPYEITLLAAMWIAPLLTRAIAGLTGVPLGLIALAALFVAALRRAMSDAESLKQERGYFAQA